MINKLTVLLTILIWGCNTHQNQNDSKRSNKKVSAEENYNIKDKPLSKNQIEKLIEEGNSFLSENKNKEGIISLPSGVQYKIIKKGEGIPATKDQIIKTHYVGTTIDGKEFDNSIKRGEPFEVDDINMVIKGWQEVLKKMPKGSKWIVYIPNELAYGERSPCIEIKPYSVLIFDMEVVDILTKIRAPLTPSK